VAGRGWLTGRSKAISISPARGVSSVSRMLADRAAERQSRARRTSVTRPGSANGSGRVRRRDRPAWLIRSAHVRTSGRTSPSPGSMRVKNATASAAASKALAPSGSIEERATVRSVASRSRPWHGVAEPHPGCRFAGIGAGMLFVEDRLDHLAPAQNPVVTTRGGCRTNAPVPHL
jgi:hypothetical protein